MADDLNHVIRFANRKYFREFDGSDNPCCWQIDEVGRDIDGLFAELGIDADVMYEDWGAAWNWCTGGVEHYLQLECTDVDNAAYQVTYLAQRPKWLVFKTTVPDSDSDFAVVAPRIRQLGTETVQF